MYDKNDLWLWGAAATLLILLFNVGGIGILRNPLLASILVGLVVTIIIVLLPFITYNSLDNEKGKSSNPTEIKSKITRSDCAELLTSKGYELYRGLNMIYSVGPIGGYGVDAVFRSKSLNEIYEFSIQVEDLNVSVKEED